MGEGPWTTGTFTMTGDPDLHPVTPSAGAAARADDVLLTWLPYRTSPNYSVMIGTSPDVTWDTAIYHGYTAATSHAVPTLVPPGDLYWKVCTSNDCSAAAGFSSGDSEVRAMRITAVPNGDTVAPMAKIGTVAPRLGLALVTNGSLPVAVTWAASDGGPGIASQQLEVRRGTAAWQPVSVGPTSRSAPLTLLPASTYQVRVRAVDNAGNVGAWSSLQRQSALYQESSTAWTWSSGWLRSTSSSASGGATRWAQRLGATATFLGTVRSIAVVAPRSASRGSAEIWIDGVRVTTIRLDGSPHGARRIAYVKTWPTASTHRVMIRVKGTAGHPRVDVDAMLTLK